MSTEKEKNLHDNPFAKSAEEWQSARSEMINTTAVVQQNLPIVPTPNYYQWECLFPELEILLKNIAVIKSELAIIPQVIASR